MRLHFTSLFAYWNSQISSTGIKLKVKDPTFNSWQHNLPIRETLYLEAYSSQDLFSRRLRKTQRSDSRLWAALNNDDLAYTADFFSKKGRSCNFIVSVKSIKWTSDGWYESRPGHESTKSTKKLVLGWKKGALRSGLRSWYKIKRGNPWTVCETIRSWHPPDDKFYPNVCLQNFMANHHER